MIASLAFILPSPLPRLTGLSNSARARNPLGLAEGGCGVKLPNSSRPLSIVPLPFLSRARKASSEPRAVQPRCSALPSPFAERPRHKSLVFPGLDRPQAQQIYHTKSETPRVTFCRSCSFPSLPTMLMALSKPLLDHLLLVIFGHISRNLFRKPRTFPTTYPAF
jgi:hypothetical protein